jgi:integrase
MVVFAMASIRENNGNLFWDFRYKGVRCREYTVLPDTKPNRTKMQKVLDKIEGDIETGTFVYRNYFPESKLAAKFDDKPVPNVLLPQTGVLSEAFVSGTPLFKDFSEQWFMEFSIGWRRSYKASVKQILDSRLLPEFGNREVSSIRREEILVYRSNLAKDPGRQKDSMISPRRINGIVLVLKQILNEAADRYHFTTPTLRIKQLKQPKAQIDPFTLEEVYLIINSVRADFKNYFSVRFFTGMRTGEIDGLKWKYIDFERRLILIRETYTFGDEDTTKNDTSQRDIHMSEPVYLALMEQYEATGTKSKFVFCNNEYKPLDVTNVTSRVWYPLLRYLGLEKRNPYQTRHTAATLWLASGEAPEWIAKQLGHASTEMLFKVYSRFVPNLTRQDGSAFERLLLQKSAGLSDSNPLKDQALTPSIQSNHAALETRYE